MIKEIEYDNAPPCLHPLTKLKDLQEIFQYRPTILSLLVLGAFCLPSNSAFAQDFDLSKDDYSELIKNNKYLYLISDKNTDLTNNSLTINGDEWTKGDVTDVRLISINTNKSENSGDYGGDGTRLPINNAYISNNKTELSNVSDIANFYQIYLTAVTDTTVSKNETTVISDSSIENFRAIRIDEISNQSTPQGNLPAIGSENLVLTGNVIETTDLSTKNLFTGIVIRGAKNSTISENKITISGGTHNTITGISAAKGMIKDASYGILDNNMTVSGSSFTELHAINESTGKENNGLISNNHLTLSGNNVLLSKNVEVSIATVHSSSSNTKSGLTIDGTLDIQNKGYNTSIYAGYSDYADVSEAVLIVDGGSIIGLADKAVEMIAGFAELSSTDNHLIWKNNSKISGVDTRSNLSYLIGGESSKGIANDNSVEVLDSNWQADNFTMNRPSDYDLVLNPRNILTGSAIVGGWGASEAKSNKVVLNNSTVKAKHIIGSISDTGDMSSEVVIENSNVEGSIQLFYSNGTGTGSDSTLTIRGADTDLSQARLLTTTSTTIQTSNNSLVIDGWTGSVCSLGAVLSDGQKRTFDNLRFINMQWENGGTILTSTAVELQGKGAYTVVNPESFVDGSLHFIQAPTMEIDESMTIIHADNGITYTDDDIINTDRIIKGNAGTALEFEGTLTFGENDISYTVEGIDNTSQTILVGDSRLAATAFVNQGSDLLERVFHGFTLSRDKYGLMTFATAEGTKANYDLSSPIKINGWNFLGGARYIAPTEYGDLTSALFVEYGNANYRTHNSHLGLDFRTDGSMQYVGGGFAIRLITPTNFYLEGSVRAGKLSTDLDRALMDASGSFYDADTNSLYAGMHLGAGYIFKPQDSFELDSYAKYFFTYTDSDTFQIEKYNETYNFENISSHRLRLGTRMSTKQNNITFMFGLAGEYEFNAESNMFVVNAPKQTSDLKGFNAFAEAGISIRPTNDSPWQFDAQVRGWEGTKEAVAGMISVNYLF